MFNHGISDLTHQADAGTAVDQTKALLGQTLYKLNSFFLINRIIAST